jgi:hypothetical protein
VLTKKKLLFLLLSFCWLSNNINADVNQYLYPNTDPSFSDYGNIGLINMPSARTLPGGSIGFKWARGQPYLRGSIVAYPFEWMEALYRYTDINDRLYSNIKAFSGGQSLKDKGFDIKFKVLKESYYFPAIAIGARDIGGTDRFASEYIVATKFINNFDFTIGLGWGKLSGSGPKITNPFGQILGETYFTRGASGSKASGGKFNTTGFFRGKSAAFFGGVEYFFSKRNGLRFKIEYDSTDFQTEGERPVKQDSSFNYGFVYPIGNQIKLNLGLIRGNTLQVGFSISGLYGKKNPIFKKNDPHQPIENSKIIKQVNKGNDPFLYRTSLKSLNERRLYLQSGDKDGSTYHVIFSNPTHLSYPRAIGRVASVLDEISPSDIDVFKITQMNADFESYTAEISREIFQVNKEINDYESLYQSSYFYREEPKIDTHTFQPKVAWPVVNWSINPALRSHIGGPDGFFFGQAWIRGDLSIKFSRSLSLTSIISIGVADNFDELKLPSDSILPHVRTDIVDYLKGGRKPSITRMQLDYIKNPLNNIYTKLSAGIYEEMFAGYGGEILYRDFKSNFSYGLEAFHVYQRDFDQRFSVQDYDVITGHANLYYLHPNSQVLVNIKGGRYLAKDSGLTFDFSRRFKSGFYVGAFFSLTDISSEEFGEGSFDKGFYFSFPLEVFLNEHSAGRTYMGLKPLTRDGAATLIRGFGLYGVTDQSSFNGIWRDRDDFYD